MAITDIRQMTLSGGVACLDFINTGLEIDNIPVERLHTYIDLLTLIERLGLMNKVELRELRDAVETDAASAAHCLNEARKIRESLYSIFSAIANHDISTINKKHLSHFNTWRGKALAAQEYHIIDDHLKLGWNKGAELLFQPLWKFVLSANELLQKNDLQNLRRCSGCDWLFYDQSKSHRRKWCDMQTCGSSAKAKRYYQRKKSALNPDKNLP